MTVSGVPLLAICTLPSPLVSRLGLGETTDEIEARDLQAQHFAIFATTVEAEVERAKTASLSAASLVQAFRTEFCCHVVPSVFYFTVHAMAGA